MNPTITIVSEGRSFNTKLIHNESGQDLAAMMPITKIEWTVDGTIGVASAIIHLEDVGVDIRCDISGSIRPILMNLLHTIHNEREWRLHRLSRIN